MPVGAAADRRAESIRSLDIDTTKTSLETRAGHEDFSRAAFTVHVEGGDSVAFEFDRCGGDWGGVRVGSEEEGGELFTLPSDEERPAMEAALAAAPGLMFYFVQCRDDYLRLLRACVDHAASGGSGPPPIVGADGDGGER